MDSSGEEAAEVLRAAIAEAGFPSLENDERPPDSRGHFGGIELGADFAKELTDEHHEVVHAQARAASPHAPLQRLPRAIQDSRQQTEGVLALGAGPTPTSAQATTELLEGNQLAILRQRLR